MWMFLAGCAYASQTHSETVMKQLDITTDAPEDVANLIGAVTSRDAKRLRGWLEKWGIHAVDQEKAFDAIVRTMRHERKVRLVNRLSSSLRLENYATPEQYVARLQEVLAVLKQNGISTDAQEYQNVAQTQPQP